MTGLFILLAFWSYTILDAIAWQNSSKARKDGGRLLVLIWTFAAIACWGITAAQIVREIRP